MTNTPTPCPDEVLELAREAMASVGWMAPSMIRGAARAIMADRARRSDPATAEVERLREATGKFTAIIDAVEARCMAADGPVTPTLQEMREDELASLWRQVQTLRAALGEA